MKYYMINRYACSPSIKWACLGGCGGGWGDFFAEKTKMILKKIERFNFSIKKVREFWLIFMGGETIKSIKKIRNKWENYWSRYFSGNKGALQYTCEKRRALKNGFNVDCLSWKQKKTFAESCVILINDKPSHKMSFEETWRWFGGIFFGTKKNVLKKVLLFFQICGKSGINRKTMGNPVDSKLSNCVIKIGDSRMCVGVK